MSKHEYLIERYENLKVDIKMYMSEVSKSKISDLNAQKIIILWKLKHVSAISEHPVNLSRRIKLHNFSSFFLIVLFHLSIFSVPLPY